MPKFKKMSEFGKNLRTHGDELLSAQANGRFADFKQWVRSLVFVIIFLIVYILLISSKSSWSSFVLALCTGFFAYIVVATLCHDASHGSLCKQKWINRAILFAGFSIIGVSGQLWGDRHVRKHHLFPNISGTNIDADSTSLIRLTPYRTWRSWHRFQILYAPFLYSTVLMHLTWVEDFQHFRQVRRESHPSFRGIFPVIEFMMAKLVHVFLAFVIPWVTLDISFSTLITGYFAAGSAASIMFVLINIGTHVCDRASFIHPNSEGQIEHDWAVHQTITAVDWSPESNLAVALTGGANSHVAHHLFPHAAHCHNARLSRLVSSYANEYGIQHNVVTFKEMLKSHIRWLRYLSITKSQPGRLG